jgi:hypothetical protein
MLHNITLVLAWNKLDTEHHHHPPPPAKIAASLISLCLSSPCVQIETWLKMPGGGLDITRGHSLKVHKNENFVQRKL